MRGLELLRILNETGPATSDALAKQLRLPRTTVHRLARTLLAQGVISRVEGTTRYQRTIEASRLSHGFDARAEAIAAAGASMHAAAERVQWPMTVATLEWPEMMIQDSTDRSSGFAVEVLPFGTRMPLLTTASGRIYLALCDAPARATLLDSLARQQPDAVRESEWPSRRALEIQLDKWRAAGFATAIRPLRLTDQGSIAIGIERAGLIVAALAVRFSLKAIPFRAAEARFLPLLRQIAATSDSGTRPGPGSLL